MNAEPQAARVQIRTHGSPAPLAIALALSLAFLAGNGCSTFNRDWQAAATRASLASSIEGRWEGTWRSEATGHHNRLRCLISAPTNGLHQARFHARYQIILPLTFTYSVPLQVTETNGETRFQGQANLGSMAGGAYSYAGTATAVRFFSTYKSSADHGTFEMTRPKPAP